MQKTEGHGGKAAWLDISSAFVQSGRKKLALFIIRDATEAQETSEAL
jgi:hypothetical protein